jgi:hypothetical protein
MERTRVGAGPASRGRRRAGAALLLLGAAGVGGCDYIAQRDLVAGRHTEADVRRLMGVPTLIWELADGSKEWDFVRGPQGIETLRVVIGPDGRYQGMTQLLTEQRFRQATPGMTRAELERMFSKPSEVAHLDPADEEVLSWRYEGDGGFRYLFNAHLDRATGRARRYSRMDDPATSPGA